MPNVDLDDESSSSKSDGSPEEERGCMDESSSPANPSPTMSGTRAGYQLCPQTELSDSQRSIRHQTFSSGERRRRKLPEIPKNRKS